MFAPIRPTPTKPILEDFIRTRLSHLAQAREKTSTLRAKIVTAFHQGGIHRSKQRQREFAQKVAKETRGIGISSARDASRAWLLTGRLTKSRSQAIGRNCLQRQAQNRFHPRFLCHLLFKILLVFSRPGWRQALGWPVRPQSPIRSEEFARPHRDGKPLHLHVWRPRKCNSRPPLQGSL